jgi:hypothetical protein
MYSGSTVDSTSSLMGCKASSRAITLVHQRACSSSCAIFVFKFLHANNLKLSEFWCCESLACIAESSAERTDGGSSSSRTSDDGSSCLIKRSAVSCFVTGFVHHGNIIVQIISRKIGEYVYETVVVERFEGRIENRAPRQLEPRRNDGWLPPTFLMIPSNSDVMSVSSLKIPSRSSCSLYLHKRSIRSSSPVASWRDLR